MESGSGRNWFLGVVIVLIIGFGFLGWRYLTPDHDVSASLSNMSVNRGDPVTFTIENRGRKIIVFGYPYEVWREEADGTLYAVELDVAWIAGIVELSRGETWTQDVFTDLPPGRYVFVKQWETEDNDTGEFTSDFTIR